NNNFHSILSHKFRLTLEQSLTIAIIQPIFECVLKAVVERIATSSQLFAADVCAYHQLLYPRRMNADLFASDGPQNGRSRHKKSARNQRDSIFQAGCLLHCFANLFDVISRLKGTVE